LNTHGRSPSRREALNAPHSSRAVFSQAGAGNVASPVSPTSLKPSRGSPLTLCGAVEGFIMTEFLFRKDAYLTECTTVVTVSGPEGFETSRTVFYAASGGQPGDVGHMTAADGTVVEIVDTMHPSAHRMRVLHLMAQGETPPAPGTEVRLMLDQERRLRLMRMHTALHLLSVVMPFPVTGGQIGVDKGRLDFNMPQPPEDLDAIAAELNSHVAADLPVTSEWISDSELEARPEMVKTMKVKPPMGQGRVRLIRIGTGADTVDLQPCGGTHVRATGEIGPLRIGRIEKKGRENRRVALYFA
jgi:misacylated tRNA(Ala) deacylase